jgi:hypothetical protein
LSDFLSGNSTMIVRLKWNTKWPWVTEGMGFYVWFITMQSGVFHYKQVLHQWYTEEGTEMSLGNSSTCCKVGKSKVVSVLN